MSENINKLTKDEVEIVESLRSKVFYSSQKNNQKRRYYNQKMRLKDLGINTPNSLRGFKVTLGWPTKAVDVLSEKIKWEGFYNTKIGNNELDSITSWLNDLYTNNNFEVEQRKAIKNAMITGIGFISASRGDTSVGEPEVIWIAEDSNTITVDYDQRTQTVKSAVKFISDDRGQRKYGILWLPNVTVEFIDDGGLIEMSRDEHNMGVVPVIPIFNNRDSDNPFGRSEITAAVRDITDAAMRRIVNAEIGAEYYAKPYRYIAGLSDEDYQGMNRNGVPQLNTKAGDIVSLPQNLNGDGANPSINQLSASDPSSLMRLVDDLARMVAVEVGVSPSYFGVVSVNPQSADAMNVADEIVIRKANSRISDLSVAFKNLAFVSSRLVGLPLPDDFYNINTAFHRTDTLTPSAAADRLSKLVAVGIYEKPFPDSVYRDLGMSPSEIVEIKSFHQVREVSKVFQTLATPIAEPDTGDNVEGV